MIKAEYFPKVPKNLQNFPEKTKKHEPEKSL